MTDIPPRVWTPSVDYLLKLVPGAFRSLLPSLSSAGIQWRDRESYDPWDHIAQVIYHEFVIEPLRHATGDFGITVPLYGVGHASLRDVSFVAIVGPAESLAFLSFKDDDRFDHVYGLRFDEDWNTSTLEVAPIDDVSFEFHHRQSNGTIVTIQQFVLEE